MREFDVRAAPCPSANLSTTLEFAPVETVSPWRTSSPRRNARGVAVPVCTCTLPVTDVATAELWANTRSAKSSSANASTADIVFMVLPPCFGKVESTSSRYGAGYRSRGDMRHRAYHGLLQLPSHPSQRLLARLRAGCSPRAHLLARRVHDRVGGARTHRARPDHRQDDDSGQRDEQACGFHGDQVDWP